jgi:hypothetical protein
MGLSQTEILERAERLASTLAGGATRVEKNVLLAVVADFMTDRRPDIQKLRRTLRLIGEGSGGHLKRAAGYAVQIKTVVAALGDFLDSESLDPEEYKSLFGWTARLLLVRGLPASRPPRPDPRSATPQRPNRPQIPPKAPAPPPQLRSIGKQSLSELQRLKLEIEEREKRDKE